MLRATFAGSAYLGVFAVALEDVLFVRADLDADRHDALAEELAVEVLPTTIGGASTVGSLVVGNGNGIVVSGQASDAEREAIADRIGRPVTALPGLHNATGNLVLANDYGALLHPDLDSEATATIRETLDVPVEHGVIGGVQTVGMAALATNAGVLCHPQATEDELTDLEALLDVPADIGTINHGTPLVGSGLIANTHGYVAGDRTTGPELGRIEAALDLIE